MIHLCAYVTVCHVSSKGRDVIQSDLSSHHRSLVNSLPPNIAITTVLLTYTTKSNLGYDKHNSGIMTVASSNGTAPNGSNGFNGHQVKPKTTNNSIVRLNPTFTPSTKPESAAVQSTITSLSLSEHIEGGYFVLSDLSPQAMPSPYPSYPLSPRTMAITSAFHDNSVSPTRLFSTTIFYYLSPNRPMGSFHKNRSRIIHTLHRGRGRYVLIHEDGRVETYIVGKDVSKGEKLSWVVEGGAYKASYLLEDEEGKGESEGLLISETVVPGFDYADHEFLEETKLRELVSEEQADALSWLVREH
jgi:hypothetical protein